MPDFVNVGNILDEDESFVKLREAVKYYDVVERFYEIFPELAAFTVPLKVVKEVLHVRVENSVWRAELGYNQKIFVEKINKFFGDNRIKSVKFLP